MKRGAVQKTKARLVNFWAPDCLLSTLDAAVAASDLDRSKFIRAAIREKAIAIGITMPGKAEGSPGEPELV